MGSQFVDLNADGHLDYLSATFDGSPHVAYGSPDGFEEPVRLKDAQGQRILITYYWDYDKKKHLSVDRAMNTENPPKERCISALAFDWDADGDFDLLLGSYENGHLYRQMNEGSNEKPKFTGVNIPVMAGSEAFALPDKMTAPRLVDWDADGDLDLVAGSFGDSYSKTGPGGGVYLSRNTGSPGQPKFAALETLIPPGQKGQPEPSRPIAGLYPEVTDYDGDGDLDLIVGGYAMWTPPGRDLSAAEEAELERLREEQKAARAEQSQFTREISKDIAAAILGLDPNSDKAREKTRAVYAQHRKTTTELSKNVRAITAEIEELVPGAKRKSFVWLYERL